MPYHPPASLSLPRLYISELQTKAHTPAPFLQPPPPSSSETRAPFEPLRTNKSPSPDRLARTRHPYPSLWKTIPANKSRRLARCRSDSSEPNEIHFGVTASRRVPGIPESPRHARS